MVRLQFHYEVREVITYDSREVTTSYIKLRNIKAVLEYSLRWLSLFIILSLFIRYFNKNKKATTIIIAFYFYFLSINAS